MSNDKDEIVVIGVLDTPVEENQAPLISDSNGKELYATGTMMVINRKDIKVLFGNDIKPTKDNFIFVPDAVVRAWLGSDIHS